MSASRTSNIAFILELAHHIHANEPGAHLERSFIAPRLISERISAQDLEL